MTASPPPSSCSWVAGSIVLAPAIVLHYAVQAAADEDAGAPPATEAYPPAFTRRRTIGYRRPVNAHNDRHRAQARRRAPTAVVRLALGLFARNGYHETSMNALATEAGITKPVIYQHFRLQARPLRSTARADRRPTAHRHRRAIDRRRLSPPARRGRLRRLLPLLRRNPDAFSVLYGSSLGSVRSSSRKPVGCRTRSSP